MHKIYMAGVGGMLGKAFYEQFKEDYEIKCTDIDVNEDWLFYLDFRNFETYSQDVRDFAPDYLFHLGAYTDLEYCELNPDDTYLTNNSDIISEYLYTIYKCLYICNLFVNITSQ